MEELDLNSMMSKTSYFYKAIEKENKELQKEIEELKEENKQLKKETEDWSKSAGTDTISCKLYKQALDKIKIALEVGSYEFYDGDNLIETKIIQDILNEVEE